MLTAAGSDIPPPATVPTACPTPPSRAARCCGGAAGGARPGRSAGSPPGRARSRGPPRGERPKPDTLPYPHLPAGHDRRSSEIKHVVVLMMENHSFDNLLGMVPYRVPGRAKVDGGAAGRPGDQLQPRRHRAQGLCNPAGHRVPAAGGAGQNWNARHPRGTAATTTASCWPVERAGDALLGPERHPVHLFADRGRIPDRGSATSARRSPRRTPTGASCSPAPPRGRRSPPTTRRSPSRRANGTIWDRPDAHQHRLGRLHGRCPAR